MGGYRNRSVSFPPENQEGIPALVLGNFGTEPVERAFRPNEAVVREHYSYIEAGEFAEQMISAFEEADQQVRFGNQRD